MALTTDVLARRLVWPRVWLARRLAGRGVSYDPIMLDPYAHRNETKNDGKQEAIASINELRAQAVNEAAVHAIGKQ